MPRVRSGILGRHSIAAKITAAPQGAFSPPAMQAVIRKMNPSTSVPLAATRTGERLGFECRDSVIGCGQVCELAVGDYCRREHAARFAWQSHQAARWPVLTWFKQQSMNSDSVSQIADRCRGEGEYVVE